MTGEANESFKSRNIKKKRTAKEAKYYSMYTAR